MEVYNSFNTVPKAELPGKPGRKTDTQKNDEKSRLRREVKKRLRYCAENRRLLRRDKMFASSHPRRFNVNGTIITDLPYLPEAWANHFSNLAQSKATDNPDLAELKTSIESLSMDNEEYS